MHYDGPYGGGAGWGRPVGSILQTNVNARVTYHVSSLIFVAPAFWVFFVWRRVSAVPACRVGCLPVNIRRQAKDLPFLGSECVVFLSFFSRCSLRSLTGVCRMRAPWPPSEGTLRSPQRASWASSGGSVGWGWAPASSASPSLASLALGALLAVRLVCGTVLKGGVSTMEGQCG